MKVLSTLCCLLIFIGIGQILTAPAETVTAEVSAVVADTTAPSQPTHDPIDQPATNGTTGPGDMLASLTRPCDGGGCSGGSCFLPPRVKRVEKQTATTVTTESSEEGGQRRVVGAVAQAGKVVCGILGRDRRVARREARRGGE